MFSRTLHLIDIENLVGSPSPKASDVAAWRDWYVATHVSEGDLVIVASSHHAFATVGFAWQACRHLVRSGRDGADLALMEVIADERVDRRFGRVVIASGDGIFADAASWLGARGVEVTVVTRERSLSRSLRMAARNIAALCEDAVMGVVEAR